MKRLFSGLFVLQVSATSPAQSGDEWRDWPLGDPLTISPQAFSPKISTVVRLDESDGSTGSTIDFDESKRIKSINYKYHDPMPLVDFAC